MKKLNLSLVTVLAMSTFAVAGGDIAPVEPTVVYQTEAPMVVEDKGFYLGLAYSTTSIDVDGYDEGGYDIGGSDDKDSVMFQLGYKFNPYIAVEGRYWAGDNELDAWGLYAKPMYPVTSAFDVYALIGYGNGGVDVVDGVDFDDGHINILDESTFQWGLGASYAFTNNIAVFVDYVELYNDNVGNVDWSLDTVNFGLTYQF